jgi:methylated-DNA-[protein]-cysteine S-methyltransferase
MDKQIKYIVFKTKWGWFGLAGNEKGLLRSCLPCPTRKIAEKHLLAGLANPQFDRNLLKSLQNKIIAYFEGKPVKFNAPLAVEYLPFFTKKVLASCRKIPSGKTVSYSQLARMIGHPRACRAVGAALAKNPIPLIIPCHRIIRSDGSLSGFSDPQGPPLKAKLIALEQNVGINP